MVFPVTSRAHAIRRIENRDIAVPLDLSDPKRVIIRFVEPVFHCPFTVIVAPAAFVFQIGRECVFGLGASFVFLACIRYTRICRITICVTIAFAGRVPIIRAVPFFTGRDNASAGDIVSVAIGGVIALAVQKTLLTHAVITGTPHIGWHRWAKHGCAAFGGLFQHTVALVCFVADPLHTRVVACAVRLVSTTIPNPRTIITVSPNEWAVSVPAQLVIASIISKATVWRWRGCVNTRVIHSAAFPRMTQRCIVLAIVVNVAAVVQIEIHTITGCVIAIGRLVRLAPYTIRISRAIASSLGLTQTRRLARIGKARMVVVQICAMAVVHTNIPISLGRAQFPVAGRLVAEFGCFIAVTVDLNRIPLPFLPIGVQ